MPPGFLLQYAYHLADEMAPADAHPAGTQPLQQCNGRQGQGLVGLAVAALVGAEDHIPQGPAGTHLFRQILPLLAGGVDRDLHHTQLPGLTEHPADQGAGDPQFLGDVTLLPVFQVIPRGHMGQPPQPLLTVLHPAPSF